MNSYFNPDLLDWGCGNPNKDNTMPCWYDESYVGRVKIEDSSPTLAIAKLYMYKHNFKALYIPYHDFDYHELELE